MNIVLIRNNPYYGVEFKKAILSSSHRLFDVFDPRQISLNKIGTDEIDVNVFNKSISDFDRIIFLNTPYAEIYPDKEDNVFAYCEIDAALIAALNYFPEKILNLGILQTNRSLINEGFLVFSLQKIGWEIHPSFFSFSGNPDKQEGMMGNLLISRSGYKFSPFADVYIPDYQKLDALIFRTQQLMWDRRLDLINLKIVLNTDRIQLHGFSTEFGGTDMELFSTLLMEVL